MFPLELAAFYNLSAQCKGQVYHKLKGTTQDASFSQGCWAEYQVMARFLESTFYIVYCLVAFVVFKVYFHQSLKECWWCHQGELIQVLNSLWVSGIVIRCYRVASWEKQDSAFLDLKPI